MAHLAASQFVFTSLLYLSVVKLGQFLLLQLRTGTRKDIEILVLRHQLAVLRRQAGPLRPAPADRALPAMLSRLQARTVLLRALILDSPPMRTPVRADPRRQLNGEGMGSEDSHSGGWP
jgi:hypothetical protein